MRRPEASQIGFRRSDFPRVRAAPSGRRKSPGGSRACIMLNPSVSASRYVYLSTHSLQTHSLQQAPKRVIKFNDGAGDVLGVLVVHHLQRRN
jgi:hypothetical protein